MIEKYQKLKNKKKRRNSKNSLASDDVHIDFEERQKICEDITQQFEDKSTILLAQDLVSFTVLCLLKNNRRKF